MTHRELTQDEKYYTLGYGCNEGEELRQDAIQKIALLNINYKIDADDIQDLYDLVEALSEAEPAIIYTESTVPVI